MFNRISFSQIDLVKIEVLIKKEAYEIGVGKVLGFLHDLQTKADLDQNRVITNKEFDAFVSKNNSIDLKDTKNKWLIDMLELASDKDRSYAVKFYSKEAKLNLIEQMGLKPGGEGLELDMSFRRALALKEAKETGMPIVVVVDSFEENLPLHGYQVAYRDVEGEQAIALPYNEKVEQLESTMSEVVKLKKDGYRINSLNKSSGIVETISVLKSALLKDKKNWAEQIESSNIQRFKKQIRDWLLKENGLEKIYTSNIFNKLLKTPQEYEDTKIKYISVSTKVFAFLEKISESNIKVTLAAGNSGKNTFNIFSFANGIESVGVVDTNTNDIANYSSETGLVNARQYVGNNYMNVIYKQNSSQIYMDWDGEKNSVDGLPDKYFSTDKLTPTTQVYLKKLDSMKLATPEDIKVLKDRFNEVIQKIEAQDLTSAALEVIKIKNDLEKIILLKPMLKELDPTLSLKRFEKALKDFKNSFNAENPLQASQRGALISLNNQVVRLYESMNRSLAKSDTNFFISDDAMFFAEITGDNLFRPNKVYEENGKLVFVDSQKVLGTSFAAPVRAAREAKRFPPRI